MVVILQEQFRNLVNSELERLHWSRAELARRMAVAPSYVSIYLNGDADPGDDVKEKFFAALGVSPRLTIEPIQKNLATAG
jgi:transcriptional regulator with XRE-family HTH domain